MEFIFYQVRIVDNDCDKKKVKELMKKVASSRNWDANKTIDCYDDCAYYYAADDKGNIIGGVKVIFGNMNIFPIKTPDAWPELQIDNPKESVEVAFSAVEENYRGSGVVFVAMYAAMFWHMQQLGYRYVYAILDPIIFRLYSQVGYRFKKISEDKGGGTKIYWGERTFPAVLDLFEAAKYIEARKPCLWEFIEKYSKI